VKTLALILMAATAPLASASTPVEQALQNGELDKATSMLASLPSAEAHLYRCRIAMMLERWDEASGECEKAVKEDPQSSLNHLWFGRALGERASRANFMSAYSLGKKVHQEFEEAVRLNPQNTDALSDLCEYEYEAPSVVGGDMDRAIQLAAQVEKLDRGRGIELHARILKEQKHLPEAEQEFKRAIGASTHPAYEWSAMASFYRTQQRWDDMESAIQSTLKAVEHDPKAATALYDSATLLLRTKRNSDLAEKLLTLYLNSQFKSDQAPAFAAHAHLAQLLDARGDKTAAQKERAAALALAHEYKLNQEHAH
jgi:tetratricopeptide (TPR) repeat protein